MRIYGKVYKRERERDCYQNLISKVLIQLPKVDTSEWKEFQINELFNVYSSKYLSPNKLKSGDIPFIDKSVFNNGVVRWVNPCGHIPYSKNCITIGDHSAKAFYQDKDYLNSDHMNRLYLKKEYGYKLNIWSGLFLCSVINATIEGKYNYSLIFAKQRCEETKILLPTKNNQPDWDFMENYIKSGYIN